MVSDPIQESLLALIEEKKKALKPKNPREVKRPPLSLINIMDALRKSVAQELRSRKTF